MQRIIRIKQLKEQCDYTWAQIALICNEEYLFLKYLASLDDDSNTNFTDSTNVRIDLILFNLKKHIRNHELGNMKEIALMLEKHQKEYERLYGDTNNTSYN